MKKARKDLEQLVETLNKLLGNEKYFLEVMSTEIFGPYRYKLDNEHGSGPLCTFDRMTCNAMYQYLRGAITGIGAYRNFISYAFK